MLLNSLPGNNILDWSALKSIAGDKLNAIEKLKFLMGQVENIVGKRRKCWFPAFSPYLTMFSKDLSVKVVKSQDYVLKSQPTMLSFLSNICHKL